MNTRTCTHTNTRVHVLTSIEAERRRERNKIKEKKKTRKEKERKKGEGREEDATTQFTMARHGAIYSPEAATFFRISTSGTVHDRSKHTHTLIYTHIGETFFQGVVSFPVVEVAAPSAGRKKDNGRKEWGSISWFLRGVLKCRLPVLAAHHGVYMRRVFR